MAPYASTYATSAASGPVQLVLALGRPDQETALMDWEELNAVDAVRQLRAAERDVVMAELPWGPANGAMEQSGGTLVVLGESRSLYRALAGN